MLRGAIVGVVAAGVALSGCILSDHDRCPDGGFVPLPDATITDARVDAPIRPDTGVVPQVFQVNLTTAGDQGRPLGTLEGIDVVATSTGWVVAWTDDSVTPSTIRFRLLTRDGTSRGLAPELTVGRMNAAGAPRLAADATGDGFLVAWSEDSGGRRSLSQRFAANGTSINLVPVGNSTALAAAANSLGWVVGTNTSTTLDATRIPLMGMRVDGFLASTVAGEPRLAIARGPSDGFWTLHTPATNTWRLERRDHFLMIVQPFSPDLSGTAAALAGDRALLTSAVIVVSGDSILTHAFSSTARVGGTQLTVPAPSSPALATSAAGRTFATWIRNPAGGAQSIEASVIDQLAMPIGVPFEVVQGSTSVQAPRSFGAVRVAAAEDGSVLVVWREFNGGGSEIFARLFLRVLGSG